MLTSAFLKDALERAVKTFAQSLLSLLTIGTKLTDVDWSTGLLIAGTAAAVSVLTSIVSVGVGSSGTASLTSAVEPAPAGKHEAKE